MLLENISSCAIAQPAVDQNKEARHREIARRYAWAAKKHKREGCEPFALLRLSELERLYESRWGRYCLPNDDAGRDDLIIAAHHILAFDPSEAADHIRSWARIWAPWADGNEIAAIVIADPKKWKADTLGWRMRLSDAERTALKIKTIGAFDVSKAKRTKRRRYRRRAADSDRRRKAGATPRSMSLMRTKPWEALRISRATYYRKRRETDSRPADSYSNCCTRICLTDQKERSRERP